MVGKMISGNNVAGSPLFFSYFWQNLIAVLGTTSNFLREKHFRYFLSKVLSFVAIWQQCPKRFCACENNWQHKHYTVGFLSALVTKYL